MGAKDPGIVVPCLDRVSTYKSFVACSKEEKDKCGACKVVGHVAHAFADRRRRFSDSTSEMIVRVLENLEDHTRVRRRLASLVNETVCLETVLSGQASVRVTKFSSLRHMPWRDMALASADEFNKWVESTKISFIESVTLLSDELERVASSLSA